MRQDGDDRWVLERGERRFLVVEISVAAAGEKNLCGEKSRLWWELMGSGCLWGP